VNKVLTAMEFNDENDRFEEQIGEHIITFQRTYNEDDDKIIKLLEELGYKRNVKKTGTYSKYLLRESCWAHVHFDGNHLKVDQNLIIADQYPGKN
jgi:hypothetical protein